MRRVAIVAFDDVVFFDLSIPTQVFGLVRLPNGRPAYEVRVCAAAKEVDAGAFRLRVRHGLEELRRADTVILPGITDIDRPVPERLLRAVRRAADAGARVASICTGAFVLAATGLLDGRRTTTHWLAAGELARRFPRVEVDPSVLYVDCGQVLTSAGAAAGLDLCLHMVRLDHGAAVAAEAARLSVVPLERDGGQAQFIVHAAPTADGCSLSRVLDWIEESLHKEIALRDIARKAAMSVRSLNRHFKEQTGTTPLQWLLRARVRRAQLLLETTARSVERVASDVGFGSVAALRQHFHRMAGTSPQAYRSAFRSRTRPQDGHRG
ncbi:GlxA family transcriptional regulator [Sorangium sp. So ce1097]|uniref:GlxA family transcriptional regulator n=1 Tax=Sorangium sp. So ce1097 TaxID=3133330 RepID=UPI003F6471EF